MEVQVGAAGASGAAATLRVKRELEGGWFQWVALPLPAVLTIQSGINQLRYATLKGIMAAKKKEIRRVSPAATSAPRHHIVNLYTPQKSRKTEIISGPPAQAARELVRRLREQARVIP
jgi:electron transfer flavoprotein beta subunit